MCETTHGRRVREWCGARFSGRAWGSGDGVFCSALCALRARDEADARARAGHQAAVDGAREPERWRPLRTEEDYF